MAGMIMLVLFLLFFSLLQRGWFQLNFWHHSNLVDQSVSQESLSSTTKPATETKSASEPVKTDSKKTDDVAAAFDDLFNN